MGLGVEAGKPLLPVGVGRAPSAGAPLRPPRKVEAGAGGSAVTGLFFLLGSRLAHPGSKRTMPFASSQTTPTNPSTGRRPPRSHAS